MAAVLDSSEVISSLLLVKAVLAILAVFLFLYYKVYWDRAKKHLAGHFLYAKWMAVKHTGMLGLAAVGFAIGFTLELFGTEIGLSMSMSRALSSMFEIGSLFSMLYVFFALALDDVPHFQHIAETVRRHHHHEHAESHARAKGKAGKKR
ncbi:TPA: hypothetical protein HA225_00225 [Candidatus Micrarchaeota archaeon]|nr:hypothetical protein [Candidatus Micrarchaeota archaeon]HIH29926.1 hypothetical protein [Candidatus Micrarchaeota archaeon]